MKNFKYSFASKIIAWILVTISGCALLGSIAGAYYINESGYYEKSPDEIREEKFDSISRRYSAYALINIGNGVNEAYFADKNFRYGIVEAADYEQLQRMDLNDSEIYEERNFTDPVELDSLTVFQCYISDNTFIYADDSLFGYYYISNSDVSYDTVKISEYVYDADNGIYYYQLVKKA